MESEVLERLRSLERRVTALEERPAFASGGVVAAWPIVHRGVSPVSSGSAPSPPSGGSGVPQKYSYGEVELD